MNYEIVVLNRIFKTNHFSRIKARVHPLEDRLVYVQSLKGAGKVGGVLAKVTESDFGVITDRDVNEFFDLSEED